MDHTVIPTRAADILREVFGHDSFRGSQSDIVNHVGAGGDALVLMPTGGGKSLCYQLPALLREGVGIVISPLIALMQDQVDAARQLGIAAETLNSAVDAFTQTEVEEALIGGRLKLLYISPERLINERLLRMLERVPLALFAIDEAHCVSQWGHDFRPEYRQLAVLHERFPQVPRVALTATADEATRAEIIEQLALGEARVFMSSFDRPNIRLGALAKDQPLAQLQRFLERHRGECGIVYCLARKRVDEVAALLVAKGIDAMPYHAGMGAKERAEHQRRFVNGDAVVMVATVAFGMGIDKPDVRFVVHLDLPKSLEGYYQEIGRAGRDGGPAEALLLYGGGELAQLRRFIDESDAPPERKHYERAQLDGLLAYAESTECRRIALLRHFGEAYPKPCGHCDNCLEPREPWDATEPARKLLSAIYRTGQRFGAAHVIEVLRGARTRKIEDFGHDKLSVHGIGGDLDDGTWRAVLRQLLARDLVLTDAERYNALRLTPAATALLKGEDKLIMSKPAPRARRKRGAAMNTATIDPAMASGDLDHATQARYERLKQWRRDVARTAGIAPFVVFHDRTLQALARARPSDEQALHEVPGIGQAKIARYGQDLLRVLGDD